MAEVRPWHPSRPATVLIGLLSVWPLLYFCFFLGFIVYAFTVMNSNGKVVFEEFRYVIVLHLLTMLLTFTLMAVYVVHAFKTDRLASDKKVLWVVVLFLGNLVAFPIYWYLYMWRVEGRAGF